MDEVFGGGVDKIATQTGTIRPATTLERLDRSIADHEQTLRALKAARDILSRNPEIETLIDTLRFL